MKEDLLFLQRLQDSYASWTGLSIIICSLEGELLTEISWGNRLTEELYRKYLTKENIKSFIQPVHSINKTILLDTELGSKVIISPVTSSDEKKHFIISGCFIDEKTIEMNAHLSKEAVEFDVLSDSEIINKVEHIKNMTGVISSYVAQHEKYNNSQIFLSIVSKQMASINNRTSTVESILQTANFFDEVDFMALALHSTGDFFKVEASVGEYSSVLKEYTFSIGEGLLGYSIATKHPQFYENIEDDARIRTFTKMNMNVKSLFCFPLIKGDEVIGLLFGGSVKREIERMSIYDKLSTSASLMMNHLNAQDLDDKIKSQSMEIATFEEIIKVLTTVKDLEKVLLILIDISMNFTRGTFTSIVYRSNPTSNQAELLSRGVSDKAVSSYLHESAQKLFSSTFVVEKSGNPLVSETPCGISIMEFPLVFDEYIYGLLSVGISSETDMGKYKTIISSIATACGIAIHFLGTGVRLSGESNLVELSWRLLQSYEPEKYELAKKVKRTALKFAQDEVNRKPSKATEIHDETFLSLKLSAREKEVLNHVVQGCSNKEIAQLLHISDHTVKNHMTNILSKLDVSDRSQAIAKIYQMGYSSIK